MRMEFSDTLCYTNKSFSVHAVLDVLNICWYLKMMPQILLVSFTRM